MSGLPTDEELRRWVVCDDRCQDPSMHEFYMGKAFVWVWPRFARTSPADKRTRIAWNRYPHNIIGLGIVLFGRGYGIQWKGSPKRHKARLMTPRRDSGGWLVVLLIIVACMALAFFASAVLGDRVVQP